MNRGGLLTIVQITHTRKLSYSIALGAFKQTNKLGRVQDFRRNVGDRERGGLRTSKLAPYIIRRFWQGGWCSWIVSSPTRTQYIYLYTHIYIYIASRGSLSVPGEWERRVNISLSTYRVRRSRRQVKMSQLASRFLYSSSLIFFLRLFIASRIDSSRNN